MRVDSCSKPEKVSETCEIMRGQSTTGDNRTIGRSLDACPARFALAARRLDLGGSGLRRNLLRIVGLQVLGKARASSLLALLARQRSLERIHSFSKECKLK